MSVTVPENGYLSERGDSWDCERRYFKKGDICEYLEVPVNGHLNSEGNAWECDRGYRVNGALCVLD